MLSSKKNRTSTEKKIFEASAKVLIVLIGLLTTNSSSWSATLAAAPHETTSSLSGIRLTQQSVTVGDITILEIDILNQKILVKGLSARFLDLVIPLVDHPTIGPNTLIGLIPVPYQTTPGIANISVDWTSNFAIPQSPKIR